MRVAIPSNFPAFFLVHFRFRFAVLSRAQLFICVRILMRCCVRYTTFKWQATTDSQQNLPESSQIVLLYIQVRKPSMCDPLYVYLAWLLNVNCIPGFAGDMQRCHFLRDSQACSRWNLISELRSLQAQNANNCKSHLHNPCMKRQTR